MPKTKTKKESDGAYLLKLVLYLILGAQWFRITKSNMQIPVPYGFVIGLLFAAHDHFQIDRKIEYALLLISMFVGFWLPVGYEVVIK
jgi:hypothetical protein